MQRTARVVPLVVPPRSGLGFMTMRRLCVRPLSQRSLCSDSVKELEIPDHAMVSIAVNDLPAQHAARIFKKVLGEQKSKSLAGSSTHISFKLTSAKVPQIREALEKHIGGK